MECFMSYEQRPLTSEEYSYFNLDKINSILWRPAIYQSYLIHSTGEILFARASTDRDEPTKQIFALCTARSIYIFSADVSADWSNEQHDSEDWVIKIQHAHALNAFGLDQDGLRSLIEEAFEGYCTTVRPAGRIDISGWEVLR